MNCINKNKCPLNRERKAQNIIYQTSLNSNKLRYEENYYQSSCETTFKKLLTKNNLTRNKIKKHSVQRKYGISSRRITTQKLAAKSYEDVPL